MLRSLDFTVAPAPAKGKGSEDSNPHAAERSRNLFVGHGKRYIPDTYRARLEANKTKQPTKFAGPNLSVYFRRKASTEPEINHGEG